MSNAVSSGSMKTRQRKPDVQPPCGMDEPMGMVGVRPKAVRTCICRDWLEFKMSRLRLYGSLIRLSDAAMDWWLQESKAFSMSISRR